MAVGVSMTKNAQTIRAIKAECRKDGTCWQCRHKREPWRRKVLQCESCAAKQKQYQADRISSRRKLPTDEVVALELPQTYRDTAYPCMRCQRKFDTPDKRKVKHCGGCREWMEAAEATLAYDADMYDSDSDRGISLETAKLRQHMGRKLTSWKQRRIAMVLAEAERLPFTRLTPEEIQAQYPQDKIDALYAKMQASQKPVLYESGRQL